MDIDKKIKLVEKMIPTNEDDKIILDEFFEVKKRYDEVCDKVKLNGYDYDVKYFEAKRAVDGMINENALDEFYEKYVSKKYYDDLEVKLNTIYSDMKKNYNIGNKIKVEEKISKFRTKKNSVEKTMTEVNKKLILGDINDLNVTEAIVGLGVEVDELKKTGEKILEEMREFEILTNSSDFSMSPSEINKKIQDFTFRCKELKIMHQNKYNARVDWTNKKIEEFKSMIGLDDEIKILVDRLTLLDRSDNIINSYTQTNYSKMMDYSKLVDVNNLIAEIQNKLEIKKEECHVNLDANISEIERLVIGVEKEQNFSEIENLIVAFGQLLETNKNNLSDDEYNAYKNRLDDAKKNISELRNKIVYENTYKELESNIRMLSHDVNNLYNMVDDLKGDVFESGQLKFLDKEKDLRDRLTKLMEELKAKKNNIDSNQYDTLMNKLSEIEKKLDEVNKNIKHPEMIKNADKFAILNEGINKLDIGLNDLDSIVKSTDKFTNKEDREDINNKINELQNEIERLENVLEYYRDKDEEKYNSILEDLNKLKTKLNDINGEYKKKCPLRVRVVKGTKNFFKKHKKICLIIAGLAAMSLVLSPVLIPAIMHGNIMIAGTTPALRPFIKFTNNILGGIIGATKDSVGLWTLKNGVCINPSCAASSLLKGLTISGVSSAPYVATVATPVIATLVIAIKKLLDKMKNVELKQKLSEGLGKSKEVFVNTTDKAKEKIRDIKSSVPKNYDKLCKEYINSEMSLEEFCKENELTEKEKEIIELKARLIKVMNENKGKKRGK